ncbi:MAG: hypothetical protein FJZ96_09540, partial [Chloroflexi bacterium]|nr:hypothetical protein [Chloroflexota bacterium]
MYRKTFVRTALLAASLLAIPACAALPFPQPTPTIAPVSAFATQTMSAVLTQGAQTANPPDPFLVSASQTMEAFITGSVLTATAHAGQALTPLPSATRPTQTLALPPPT